MQKKKKLKKKQTSSSAHPKTTVDIHEECDLGPVLKPLGPPPAPQHVLLWALHNELELPVSPSFQESMGGISACSGIDSTNELEQTSSL